MFQLPGNMSVFWCLAKGIVYTPHAQTPQMMLGLWSPYAAERGGQIIWEGTLCQHRLRGGPPNAQTVFREERSMVDANGFNSLYHLAA